MTGYYDSQLVGGTGAGNGPYRFRFADGVSQLLITDGFTARYRAQCLPDLLLKSSAANVQWSRQRRIALIEAGDHFTHMLLKRKIGRRAVGSGKHLL